MRRWAFGALLVLVTVGVAASVLGVWAKRTFLDTDRFTGVVMGLAAEPAVADAVSKALVVLRSEGPFSSTVLSTSAQQVHLDLIGLVAAGRPNDTAGSVST